MKTLIIETNEIKELPQIAIDSDDLVQGTVQRVDEEDYDFIMTQEDYDWWCQVQEGIDLAEEKGVDTTFMEYEDYRTLAGYYR